ncbi:MAG: translocation/assembly module TamB domain-containing protein [Calditrichaeota bacterium]|nr:translocation/assembly module TamB domain-containing protein [Calditrichota bacterium]
MSKPHRHSWPFYLFVIGFSLFLSGYLLWRYTPIKNEVEAVIIGKMQPYLGESFIIRDFRLGWSSISFLGVGASDQQANISLDIREIRIGLDWTNLFDEGPTLPNLIESATIIRPRLSYQPSAEKRERPKISPEKVIEEIFKNLQRVPSIDHISVEGGSWYWQLDSREQLREASEGKIPSWVSQYESHLPMLVGLNGQLKLTGNGTVLTMDLEGSLPELEKSRLHLNTHLNFNTKQLNGSLSLEECVVTSRWPFWKMSFFDLHNALLSGEVYFSNRDYTSEPVQLGGALQVRDFSAHIFNQHATADKISALLYNRTLEIQPFDCGVEEGRGTFYGSIPDLFQPEVDWYLDIDDYPVDKLRQSHWVFQYADKGLLAARGHFAGPFKQMTITANITCPDLMYSVVPFNTTSVDLSYHLPTKMLNFERLRADFYDFRTVGTGHIDFKTYQMILDLDSDISVPAGYFNYMTGLNSGRITAHTDFSGDVSTRKFKGLWTYNVSGPDSALVLGRGPFTLDDQLLKFQLASTNTRRPFKVTGAVEDLFTEARFNIVDGKDFPIAEVTDIPILASFMEDRHMDFYLAGPWHSLFSKAKVVSADRLTEVATTTFNAWEIFFDNQSFKGRYKIHTAPRHIEGAYSVVFDENGMDLRFNAPDLLDGQVYMGNGDSGRLSGLVTVDELAIESFIGRDSTLARLIQQGFLSGTATFGGTMGNPEMNFNAAARDFIINNVGYYATNLVGDLKDGLLRFNDVALTLNTTPIVNADFSWRVQSDQLDLRAGAEAVESNFLAETIFGSPDVIKGDFTYNLRADGSIFAPSIRGTANVRNGLIGADLPFRDISLAFHDSLMPGRFYWDPENHHILVDNFRFVHRDQYALNATGLLSIDEDGPLDMQVEATGNILAELPRLDPFFTGTASDGQLITRIRGTRANPFLDQLRMEIFDGEMTFLDVIPRITRLRAEIALEEGSNFINIKTIEGLVDGKWGRIANVRNLPREAGNLEPWYFDEINLNFGILTVETEKEGIPLLLYGMMEEGDRGYFATAGRTPAEKFYFAGPPDLPIARGRVDMYNARVTYPFIGMIYVDGEYVFPDTGEEDKVMDFLMNMRWDVEGYSGSNNRYFVNIPAYVGEVEMDLNIDNNASKLYFTGRLIDESFRIEGDVRSTRGRVEYLDVKFRVEEFGAEFSRYDIYPDVYGKAYTTVRDRNTEQSIPRDIYLILYVTDPVTGKEVSKGNWEDFRFKLVSNQQIQDKVFGETQEQVLAFMGYSFDNLQTKAGEVGLSMTENLLFRPLVRPLERRLERQLWLDEVRLRSNFSSNLLYLSFADRVSLFNRATFLSPYVNNNLDPALLLLQSSEITLGKYLVRDIFMSYTGQLVSGFDESKLGVNHTIGLEYRLLYNLLLQLEYNKFQFNPFYSDDIRNDLRVRLRHSFTF